MPRDWPRQDRTFWPQPTSHITQNRDRQTAPATTQRARRRLTATAWARTCYLHNAPRDTPVSHHMQLPRHYHATLCRATPLARLPYGFLDYRPFALRVRGIHTNDAFSRWRCGAATTAPHFATMAVLPRWRSTNAVGRCGGGRAPIRLPPAFSYSMP